MDKVSSHFARSPFAHPRAVFFSSSRLSPLSCLSIFQRFALASVTLASDLAACLCLSQLFSFFFEFSSVFSTPLEKLAPPAETNSTFLLIPLLRAA